MTGSAGYRRVASCKENRLSRNDGRTDEPDPSLQRAPVPQPRAAGREQVRPARARVRAGTLTPAPWRPEERPLQHRAPRRPPTSRTSYSGLGRWFT